MSVYCRQKTICFLITICCAWVAGLGIAVCQTSESEGFGSATPERHRLRISWGGGTSKAFSGSIKITNGKFARPTILGFNPESSSGIRFDSKQILVRKKSASPYEGIDVDAVGGDAKILVDLAAPDGSSLREEYEVSQVLVQDQVAPLDDQNNRVSIVRGAGDNIGIAFDRPHLIFEVGETFDFDFWVNAQIEDASDCECLIELQSARSTSNALSSEIVRIKQERQFQPLRRSLRLPSQEGVYNLRFQINPGRRNALYRRRTFDRDLQLVVLDTSRRFSQPNEYGKLVQEIDPNTLQSSLAQQQLAQFSRRIGLKTNQSVGRFNVSPDQLVVQLPVGGWQAVPININEVGKPHIVELEYSTTDPMSLGFSILQPDESGQVPNFGFDSGLYVPDSIVRTAPQDASGKHRFLFWPNTKRVYLLIANRHVSQPATYQGIRIFQSFENGKQETIQRRPVNPRRSMAFYEQPLLIENFAVQNAVDPVLNQSIHDWESFYQSIVRLAQYLVDSGSAGAYINVLGEGSALMPLKTMLPSPRYDSGVFSSTAKDPIRKDVVELIYRIFAREGLTFVPVLSFDALDARVEFSEFNASHTNLTDLHGQSVRGEGYPSYNPLSHTVQNVVTETVAEVAERYGGRPFFKGIAVVCRPDTCTLLPGVHVAGYDAMTLQRFGFDLGKNRQELLSQEQHDRWIGWRSQQMSQWYRQISEAIRIKSDDAKLYLAFIDVFKNDELKTSLSPTLHRSIDVGTALRKIGLELATLNKDPNIVVMQPETLAPVHSLAARKSEITAQRSQQWSQWQIDSETPTGLFLHRSSWARFENLEASDIFPRQSTPIFRLQHLNPAGVWNCERFAKLLLESDAQELVDGGLLLNTNLDKELVAFRQTYARLPEASFADVPHKQFHDERHPIAVRVARVAGATYWYCINGSPWNVHLTVRVNQKDSLPWSWLSREAKSNGVLEDGGKIQLTLRPFQLVAAVKESDQVAFQDFQYSLPESASRELNKNYYELRARVIAAGKAKPIDVLKQPSFENGELSAAWSVGNQEAASIQFGEQNSVDGVYSLKIENRNESTVWVRSNPFQIPKTGRLSVSVWLRTQSVESQPPLRISVEGSGSNYYRFAEVGASSHDQRNNQLSTQWSRFVVHFDDLPTMPDARLRVGFDLMGDGVFWVDQVELFDRWMDEDDLKALTQIFAGVGNLSSKTEKMESCRQILNGYWPQFLRQYFDEPEVVNQEIQIDNSVRSSMRRRFRRFVSPGIFQFR